MADSPQVAPSTGVSDRRNSKRVHFGARITVGEYTGGVLPKQTLLRPVKASNLSQTGISFVTTVWPSCDRLIVCFGDQDPVFVTARIVNCRCEELGAGDRRFEVSCEFCEWLEPIAEKD